MGNEEASPNKIEEEFTLEDKGNNKLFNIVNKLNNFQ